MKKKFKIKYAHGTAIIRAYNKLEAQIKFRKKYQIDFISIDEVK